MNMYRAVLEKWEEETNQKDKYARTGIGFYFAVGKGGGLQPCSSHELIILSSDPKKKINSTTMDSLLWRVIYGGGMQSVLQR